MDVPGWVAILTAIAGIFGGTFGAWLLSVYKERNTVKLAEEKQTSELRTANATAEADLRLRESEQAFKMYKEFVESMKKDMGELQDHMRNTEKERLDCREENATLKADLRVIRGELESLKRQVNPGSAPISLKIDEEKEKKSG